MTEKKALYYTVQPVYEDPHGCANPHIKCAATGETLRGGTEPVHFMALSAHLVDGLLSPQQGWLDRPDDFTVPVEAAHPCMPGNKNDDDRWDRNLRARDLIGNRHSKGALIDVVHWLLTRAERAEAALVHIDQVVDLHIDDSVEADEIIFDGDNEAPAVIGFIKTIQTIAKMGLGLPLYSFAKDTKAA